jgi:hypothetical protein
LFSRYITTVLIVGVLERGFELPLTFLSAPAYFSSSPYEHYTFQVNPIQTLSISLSRLYSFFFFSLVQSALNSTANGIQCALRGVASNPGDECQGTLALMLLYNLSTFLWLASGIAVLKFGNANFWYVFLYFLLFYCFLLK